jgi:hypothetical protein
MKDDARASPVVVDRAPSGRTRVDAPSRPRRMMKIVLREGGPCFISDKRSIFIIGVILEDVRVNGFGSDASINTKNKT